MLMDLMDVVDAIVDPMKKLAQEAFFEGANVGRANGNMAAWEQSEIFKKLNGGSI